MFPDTAAFQPGPADGFMISSPRWGFATTRHGRANLSRSPPKPKRCGPGGAHVLRLGRSDRRVLACPRQHEGERRAAANLARDGDIAVHRAGQLTADRETETDPVDFARQRSIGL